MAKYFNVETVILVGAPVIRDYIDPSSKIKRIINIYSKDDILKPLIDGNFVGKTNIEVINIQLEGGLSHTNYFFDPNQKDRLILLQAQYDELLNRTDFDSIAMRFNLNRQIIELKQEIEKTLYADAFIARLAKNALNENDWNLFKQDLPAASNGIINLDPKDFAGKDISSLKISKGIS